MASSEFRPALGSGQVELDPTVDPLSRFGSRVRALVWPTRTLVGQQRWFDELYVWTADFEPDRGAFRSWIFGYARMVLMEALRKARPAGARGRSELFEESYPDAVTTFTRRIARDEAMQRFLECMHGLGEDEKTLVILCGLEGQTCADAAERLGISHDAALKRWQRLRADIASRGWTKLLAEDS